MTQATTDVRTAAELIGIPPEQFALGLVHYHALTLGDHGPMPTFHLERLLAAANAAAEFIVPNPGEGPDDPEEEVPDFPTAPIADIPEPVAEAVPPPATARLWDQLRDRINSAARNLVSPAERK
jgi:hypothetical protein